MDINKTFEIIKLFDLYSNLLTDKQQSILNDYLNNDLSLSEIAEINKISRQAVNYSINLSLNSLYDYEDKLKFSFKKDKINQLITDRNNQSTNDILDKIKNVLEE